jgi:hypothetical protein
MRWLTSPLQDRPSGLGERLVGAPDVETVRRITGVYRTLDNQFGGGHVRESVVRFLDAEVSVLLRGRYDAHTGAALMSAAAETTQLAGWAAYDPPLTVNIRYWNEPAKGATSPRSSSPICSPTRSGTACGPSDERTATLRLPPQRTRPFLRRDRGRVEATRPPRGGAASPRRDSRPVTSSSGARHQEARLTAPTPPVNVG